MPTRAILKIGANLLRQKSRLVEDVTAPYIREVVDDMLETMKAANGAGLAAPQIGEPLRIIIFGLESNPRYPEAEPVPLTVLINPQYEVVDNELEAAWEGCLSIPGMRGVVHRCRGIRYWGLDLEGNRIERQAHGFHARVFMHEYDHLDGVLYVDRIGDLRNFGYIAELEADGRIPNIAKD